MSHKHANRLETIFRDPISANIFSRELEAHAGARPHAWLNGREGVLGRPQHGDTLGRQDVKHLQEFLARACRRPSQYEAFQEEYRNS